MPQVLVKHAPSVNTYAQAYNLPTNEDRDAFVKDASVWWYSYPDQDDWSWHRGGAWAGAGHIADAAGVPRQTPVAREEALPRPLPPPAQDEEDSDDRW